MRTEAPAVSFKTYGGDAAENYERYFVPTIGAAFVDTLLRAARMARGERVLDVACGTGIVARRAVDAVGRDGSVSGVDLNPAMLAVARKVCPDVAWHEASAESLPLDDGSVDVVTCSLGLMFVPDKPAALREMRRVLADGGRAVIGTVQPNPFFDVLERAIAEHVNPQVAAFMAQVFSLGDPSVLEQLLADAGFRDVSAGTEALTIDLPSPAEFLWQYVSLTPLAGVVADIGDAKRGAIDRDVVSGWQRFVRAGILTFEANAVLSTGRK